MFMKIYGYVSCPFNLQPVILVSDSYRKSLYETENTNKCNEINPLYYSLIYWSSVVTSDVYLQKNSRRLW